MLSRLVGLRHQIYNQLLVECEKARINEQFHANAITIVESATIPDEPATPNLPVNAALGLVAGLSMGCVTAFLLTGLDNTLQSIEDVQSITTLPILCKIPELTRKSAVYRHINLNRCERSFPMAALEQVCAQLTMPDSVPKFKSFGVTSPEPGSGKSTFAANLALSLAQKGKKVVLIELHSNRRLDRSYLGFTNGPGISNFMVGEIDWERALHATAYPNLWIITSGSSLTNDLLTPKAIREIMIHLKTRCHVVLLDMADLRSIADPTALFSYTDTIIMVVARNKTQKQSLQDALERVEEYNAKIWGVVFNRNTTSQAYGYYAPGKLSKHLSAVERSQISTPN
jgi:capsular exopolysaccharide synthesis family protein